jgi:hypothetical protein
MSGSIEHKAEAVRRVMASLPILARAPLGSWFEGRKDTGTVGLVQTIVTTTMRYDIWAESWLARGLYWASVLAGPTLSGFWIWVLVHNDYPHDALVAAPLIFAASLALYPLGWGWRWLWTGRTDHLFAGKSYTRPGRLDEMRKNLTSVLAFLSLGNF